MQLGRDAHHQRQIERVVVRLEGLGRGARHQRVHHRRLDLEEVARVEEVADELHQLRALLERLAHRGVRQEVDVATAVALLDVGQRLLLGPGLRLGVVALAELAGQRAQRLAQERELRGRQSELARLRLEERALHAHEVGEVDQLPDLERLFAERVFLDVHLQSDRCGPAAPRRRPCRSRARTPRGEQHRGDGHQVRRQPGHQEERRAAAFTGESADRSRPPRAICTRR